MVSGGPGPQSTPSPTPLSITVTSLPAATAKSPYSATLSATGATAPYKWSMASGSLPTGLGMSAAGQISGTPAQAGSFSFTAQVTDSSSAPQTASANLDIVVKAAAVTPPAISTSSLPGGQVNSAYTASLSGTGGTPAYSWTLLSGQLPPGLALNASSGAIAGTPSQSGSYSFTVKLTDSGNPVQTDVANLSISIAAVNSPLQVTTTSLPAGETGSAYTATLGATGGVAPYSWSLAVGTLPSGLTLSAAGQVSGTPTQAANSSITVQVKDSASPAATATKALSISVVVTGGTLQITTASLPNGKANVAYSTTLAAIGGTKPYIWSISAGSLPSGLALNSSSGVVSGTPTQSGGFSVTFQAKDSAGAPQTATKALSLTVAAAVTPVQITTASLSSGPANSPYGATLSASGGTTPYTWSLSSGTLPTGLTLNSSTGQIGGTPTQAATSSFTVQVKDSTAPAQTATKALSITITAVVPPVQITTSALAGAQVSATYSASLAASGGKTPYSWSLSAGTLPAGLSLNASGQITGTPTASGTVSFTVKVTDSSAPAKTATANLSIVVAAAVTPPVTISTTSLPGGTVSSAYSSTLAAAGGKTPYSWSLSAGSLPAGLNLSGAGVISGTPTASGTVSFTVKVTDSSAPAKTATANLSIVVAAAVTPPVTISTTSLPGGTVSSAYSSTLAAAGGKTPYSWSLSAGSLPAGLNLSSAGVISGTPTASGTVSFTVKVTDSSAPAKTATANLSIVVAAVVTPPVTISTTSLPGGTVSSAYSTTLAAAGGKTPYSWSLSAGSLPAGLNLSNAGVISGTPTAAGTVSFTVKVTDSSAPAKTATANLSIVVAAVVTPPVTISTTSLPGGTVSSAYSSTLAAAGGKTPYSWSLSAGSLPAGLNLSGAGVISGTPTAAGTVSFTVKVTDSSAPAKTATANLSIVVAAVVTPPVTISTTSLPGGTVSSAYSSTLAAAGGKTPYSWSLSGGSLPAGLNLSSAGVISGTPTAAGTVSFTVKVTDSSAPAKTATANLSIAVAAGAPLQITTTSLPDGQVSSSYSKALAATGGKTPYTWSIASGSLPAGLALAASTGQITGTPTATGTSSFTVSVKDSSTPQQTDTQVLSIFVSAAVTGTSVTACGTLGNSGASYTLQNNVSASGTCFTVSANNISLNLNGHTVTYNTGNQANAHAISVTTGNSQGFSVSNGTLTESSGATASNAHVINMGVVVSGPSIHDITFNWSSGFSQAINTDYGNSSVPNGAMVYNNTLNNNSAGSCGQVSCRDLLQSASIRISNAIRSSNPPQLYGNTINGGPQGALECDAPGCIIHDNVINPGNATVDDTNDFAIWCWASCNAYNNTIMTPLTGNSEGRGIQLSGVETSTNGANVHNNTITVTTRPNNAEYGGCELGGTYGIQFDDNGKGGTAQNNNVTAVADQCWATGLRLTDTETTANVSQNNSYKAIRNSGSQACNYIGGSEKTACAHAVALASPTGFLSKNDTFQGDSDILFFDWDGGSGVTFISPTFLKGTTNPSPNFHTFVFRNGGTLVSNIHVQDANFGSGTSATDTDLPGKSGNNQAASVFIDWSQTITVNKSGGGAASGATVSFTDALGKTFSATANSSGVATVVVPQYRLNNDSGANGIENHNPFTRSVSASGCSTNTTTGLSISGTGSATITLGGC